MAGKRLPANGGTERLQRPTIHRRWPDTFPHGFSLPRGARGNVRRRSSGEWCLRPLNGRSLHGSRAASTRPAEALKTRSYVDLDVPPLRWARRPNGPACDPVHNRWLRSLRPDAVLGSERKQIILIRSHSGTRNLKYPCPQGKYHPAMQQLAANHVPPHGGRYVRNRDVSRITGCIV